MFLFQNFQEQNVACWLFEVACVKLHTVFRKISCWNCCWLCFCAGLLLIEQCCGSGSGSVESVCFWAFRIRLSQVRLRLQILPLSSKNSKKNVNFYCSVTSLLLFIFKELCKCMFLGFPDPDPFVKGPDPYRTKCHGSATPLSTVKSF